MSNNLNADKALIFRVIHRSNLSWILEHGVHCRSSFVVDAGYVDIGNAELIEKRTQRPVTIPPGGALSDYVPFYFTPYSPMMLNIKTGYGGIRRRANEEIVILVSSLHRLTELGIAFVFSDRHAYLTSAQFSSDLTALGRIDWGILQRQDFKRDPEDPGKLERYQAEALVHRHVPIDALLGIGCYTEAIAAEVQGLAGGRASGLKIMARPRWYFQ